MVDYPDVQATNSKREADKKKMNYKLTYTWKDILSTGKTGEGLCGSGTKIIGRR